MAYPVMGLCENLECGALAGGGGGGAFAAGPLTISAGVGRGGANRPDDVRAIQDALNRIDPAQGGADPKLEVDGLCGDLTKGAITTFQVHHFGWGDGRVDPDKQSIARMRELLPGGGGVADAVEMASIFENQAVAMDWVSKATLWLAAARDRLRAVIAGSPGNTTKRELEALNKYFHLDRVSPEQALGFTDFIGTIYQNMKACCGHVSPMTEPGTGYFQLAPAAGTGPKVVAFTYPGGFTINKDGKPRLAGEAGFQTPPNVRTDAMYFFPERLKKHKGIIYPYAIVHELAHFVGGEKTTANSVDDHSYFHRQNYFTLSPYWAVRTADAYSRFAAHAKHKGPIKLFKKE